VTRYRGKPVEIEAERADRDKLHRLSPEFRSAICHEVCDGAPLYENGRAEPHVHVRIGPSPRRVNDGDWLVRGVPGRAFVGDGGVFPVGPDDFAAAGWEPVLDEAATA